MDGFETKLELLSDTLEKKLGFLRQILTITENQEAILAAEPDAGEDLAALNAMFHQMNDEKQNLIDELLNSDRFFENIFNEISGVFEANASAYKSIIARMQSAIRQVTDFDVKIRLQEQRNRQAQKPVVKGVDFTKASREYLLKQYEKNNEREE